ncbi:MAG: ATP-binding protein [Thermoproteota archaeon]
MNSKNLSLPEDFVVVLSIFILALIFILNNFPLLFQQKLFAPYEFLVLFFFVIFVSTFIVFLLYLYPRLNKSNSNVSYSLLENDLALLKSDSKKYFLQLFRLEYSDFDRLNQFNQFFDFLYKSGISMKLIADIYSQPNNHRNFEILILAYEEIQGDIKQEYIPIIKEKFNSFLIASKAYSNFISLTRLEGSSLLSSLNLYFLSKKETTNHNLEEQKNLGKVLASLFLPSPSVDFVNGISIASKRKENLRGVILGKQLYKGEFCGELVLPIDSLFKHSVIVGVTGSGKSTTNKQLLKELNKLGFHFLLFDFHDEYDQEFSIFTSSFVFRFLGETSVDFLSPFEMKDFSNHVSIVTDVFNNVYSFSPSQFFVFRDVLSSELAYSKVNKARPTIKGVVDRLESYEPKSFYENETKFSLLRRLKLLSEGEGNKIFAASNLLKINDFLNKNVILKISDIKDSDLRKLTVSLLLALIYEYRLVNGPDNVGHFISLEEAQNFVPFRNRTDEASIYEKMFFEMRKYKESLILIAQFPSQIYPDLFKSCEVKIVHRLFSAGDAALIEDILGIDKNILEQLKSLPVGRALVFLPSNRSPITVQVNEN